MNDRVLIVDDDESVLAGLAANLEDAGYSACLASSGADALRLVEESPVDLVLVDLVMEGMDGMELLRRLGERRPRVPVIVLTGHGTPANAVEALREGAADFIQKPARPEEIVRRAGEVLDAGRLQRRLTREHDRSRREDLHSKSRRDREQRMAALRVYSDGLYDLLRKTADDLHRAAPKLIARLREDPELKESIETLSATANETGALVRRLRQLGAGEGAGTERMDLNATIQRLFFPARNTHRSRAPHLARRLVFHPASTAPCISGSPSRIERALRILVENAFDGLPAEAGVEIRITVRPVSDTAGHYGPVPPEPCAVVGVREPRRLPPEQADSAFEPFFADTVMGRTANDGFRLTIAYVIAEAHGGCVGITCEREATEWMLMLPMARKAAAPEVSRVGEHGIPRGLHVLVVDDQPAYQDEATRILADLGCRVTAAATGLEALDIIAGTGEGDGPAVDVVLLDLVLGDAMDGVDVLDRIRKLRSDLRVILVGGFGETDRVVHARSLGISDYLCKPLTPEILAQALAAL